MLLLIRVDYATLHNVSNMWLRCEQLIDACANDQYCLLRSTRDSGRTVVSALVDIQESVISKQWCSVCWVIIRLQTPLGARSVVTAANCR